MDTAIPKNAINYDIKILSQSTDSSQYENSITWVTILMYYENINYTTKWLLLSKHMCNIFIKCNVIHSLFSSNLMPIISKW